jgi:NAD(P)-dependent dehydrogenase (short-subunit alcohol dehydrogenase family)
MNAGRIEGAVALVTSANRGIGRALTEALLTRGVGDRGPTYSLVSRQWDEALAS